MPDLPRRGAGGVPGAPARTHLLVSVAAGAAAGVLASATGVPWPFAPPIGWIAGGVVYLAWMWTALWPMDAPSTARHDGREDPGRAAPDAVVLTAAVASLAAVALLLTASGANPDLRAGLSVGSVAVAWAAVHTTFAVRYARLYYAGPDGGIDFNSGEPPAYTDFAYLAFTIGMTFQVSDTAISARAIRATALRHGLLSFLFGTVVIATTINLLAGLGR
ncbi:DUF1345 domain-containing protein [Umezawaea endophytica]|uniref:DUF1345 domain-containing protein n=1 Tax=Umezawaea endophytica TaxID=1654476 RepID=UPI0035EB99D6